MCSDGKVEIMTEWAAANLFLSDNSLNRIQTLKAKTPISTKEK
jgi:hypothetical protein